MIRSCQRASCTAPATHYAEILVYGKSQILHPPAVCTLGLFVCTAHATEATAREVLTDRGKQQLESVFRSAGKALPDWSRSFARWKETTER